MENAATFNQGTAGAAAGTVRQIGEGAAEAGRQIWLASLGLVALAGKAIVGTGRTFEVLVKEGEEFEPKITSGVKKSWAEVSSTVESVGSKVPFRRAEGEAEEKLSRFDEKVKSYLERFGVATSGDMQQILSRLESIEKRLSAAASEAEETVTAHHSRPKKQHHRHEG
jgi:hypothetical protein